MHVARAGCAVALDGLGAALDHAEVAQMFITPRRPMRSPSMFTRPQPPSSVPSDRIPRCSTA
jgi:hypothetical protein